MDVIVSDHNTTVLDFKVHDIRDKDRWQIKGYQRYLLHSRRLSPTRLYGFAVDLLRGREEACHYRPIDDAFVPKGGYNSRGIYRSDTPILATPPPD